MLQLPVIVVLVISMFAGRVSPVMQKEVEVNDEGNTRDAVLNNTSSTVNGTIINNKSDEQIVKKMENVTEKTKEVNVTVASESLPDTGAATSVSDTKKAENKNENCTDTQMKEQENMLHCNVTPHDDDDSLSDPNLPSNTSEPTTTVTSIASNKTEVNAESQIPEDKDKEGSGKKKPEVAVNNTRTTDHVSYEVITEPHHLANTNHSDASNVDLKQNTNNSEASIVSPLLEEKAAISSDNVEAVKSEDPKAKRMPSGVIALVTAISFAVVIAMVYIGMILWRRYVEYRYGHRELLVNELEFDTNDLRHFEL